MLKNFASLFKNLPLNEIVTRKIHNWGGNLNYLNLPLKERIISCTFPWYSLTIFFNGKICLCPQDFNGKLAIGDINRSQLKEVFNNEKIYSLRNKFKNKDINNLIPCNKCDRIRRNTAAGIPFEYLKPLLKNIFPKI